MVEITLTNYYFTCNKNEILHTSDGLRKYAEGHKNSVEFDNMITAMTYVTNWGTKDDLSKLSKDAPKTYEEAVNQLKDSVAKYEKAKKDQRRWFPTKLRYLRLELAKAIDAYADTQKENMKDVTISKEVADSWDKFFENKGRGEVLEEKDVNVKAIDTGDKKLEENKELEDEMDEFGL